MPISTIVRLPEIGAAAREISDCDHGAVEGGIRLGALPRLGAGRRASGRDTVVLGRPAGAAAAVYSSGIAAHGAENGTVPRVWRLAAGTGLVCGRAVQGRR